MPQTRHVGSDSLMATRDNTGDPLLFGQIRQSEFLRDYWQRKPLLLRQALPDFRSPLSVDEVAGLALEDSIESRLVLEQPGADQPWSVHHGPFTEATLTDLPESHWSLLVQAVDQWVPEVAELLSAFRFLPAWRLDDIMISVAPEHGSVGPHFDQYDVFLLQVEGHRRWTVGPACSPDTPILEEAPLRILHNGVPQPSQSWTLAPGDMLYLPPQLAHHGVALDTCMTWSIGFRAPDAAEALQGLALRSELEETIEFLRYSDAGMGLSEAGTPRLTGDSLQRLRSLLAQVTERDDLLADWLGAFMTQNKYDLFDWRDLQGREDEAESVLTELTSEVEVRRALPTRLSAWGTRLYVNGRAFLLSDSDQPLIDLLLDRDSWTGDELLQGCGSEHGRKALSLLLLSGSLELVAQ